MEAFVCLKNEMARKEYRFVPVSSVCEGGGAELTEYGDYNGLLNRVTQGDCLEVMRLIPDKSIDMILCDLPYGITRNKWDNVIDLDKLWEHYKRIIKDDGAIVLTASQPFTTKLISSNMSMFKYCWVWKKSQVTGFLNAKKQPLREHEDICVFYKKQCTYNPQMIVGKMQKKNTGGKSSNYNDFEAQPKTNNLYYPKTIIDIPLPRFKNGHPTQKPVALFEYLIRTYTNEGEVVLDNCIGSGTTAVAAINTNRQFIGIEREAKYVEIANKRIAEALERKTGGTSLFPWCTKDEGRKST